MFILRLNLFLFLIVCSLCDYTHFPKGFRFGIGTSSYQIEGAWNISDKGENIWDRFTHTQSYKIKDGSNGDVACDSYHNYKRDVEMLVELGVDFYRFSISWSRVLPKGHDNYISQDGINYYNNLIDELIKYNITPMITLFHWDTPQVFQDMGGWLNPSMIDYFEDYARVMFEKYGDRVKEWITFNEPINMCWIGYGGGQSTLKLAPDIHLYGTGEYECTHNVIKAHAKVYHLYKNNFKRTQKGRISYATVFLWTDPETNSTEDVEISNRSNLFMFGWNCHPIFSKDGDYPSIMREEIDKLSAIEGFRRSRLPKFTPEEVAYIRGTYDFISINYYVSVISRRDGNKSNILVPSFQNDLGYTFYQREEWTSGSSWKIYPQGLRKCLVWISKEYNGVEIYITENGYASKMGLNDKERVDYLNDHLSSVLEAIYDYNISVTAYAAWSLMDNFEWSNGYTERLGLYEVDFSSPNRTRTPRMSALVYGKIINTRTLNRTYYPRAEEPKIRKHDPHYGIITLCILTVGFITVFFVRRLIDKWNDKRRQTSRK